MAKVYGEIMSLYTRSGYESFYSYKTQGTLSKRGLVAMPATIYSELKECDIISLPFIQLWWES